jgi:hypothetical protein
VLQRQPQPFPSRTREELVRGHPWRLACLLDRLSAESVADGVGETGERCNRRPEPRDDPYLVVVGHEDVEVRSVDVVRDGQMEVRVSVEDSYAKRLLLLDCRRNGTDELRVAQPPYGGGGCSEAASLAGMDETRLCG